VALAYGKYLPQFGVEVVHPQEETYDLVAGHVGQGVTGDFPSILHCHGLHWTGDFAYATGQYGVNKQVIDAARNAAAVTVPSAWVAESFQRDMRFTPHVIPHGIDVDAWAHGEARGDYVLWNKGRSYGVCDPAPVVALAQRFKKTHFVSTFLPRGTTPLNNVNRIGLVPHDQMKQLVQNAQVYLSTAKETFGIGTLEAMASGVPVLGFAYGGNVELVQHGVNGYLARPGDMDDLAQGLNYCLKYRDKLGKNGAELARRWTWERAVGMVAGVYRSVLEPEPPTVVVVIPCYNLGDSLGRAIESVRNQSSDVDIIVVDDGSSNSQEIESVVEQFKTDATRIGLIRQSNAGVAAARNAGILAAANSKYISCLDADDAIAPEFIERCVRALEADRSLGIAYTGLWSITPDGKEGLSHWPGEWNYDAHLKRQNQVPTCCVFRREMWERLGGYRQRYAPQGAGEEDAEFWLRAGAYGYKAKKVDQRGLFLYSHQSGRVSGNREHRVTDWTAWHPWAGPDGDGTHPFASYATPERHSHPVRQYDEPTISVVIPVGPGHEKHVFNALDSLEAQTFRGWEVIIIDDTTEPNELNIEFNCGNWSKLENELRISYPYARHVTTRGQAGAGYARNQGAEMARAPLLVFLDADDWLRPDALEKMLHAWNEHQAVVYSDYTSKAIIRTPYLKELEAQNRLHAVIKQHQVDDETWHEVAYKSRAFDYDCERAQRQPEADAQGNYYIWCNVTALIPLAWHQEIGGFDEELESWEDVDYHWRLAKAGKCYHRIEQELLIYNFPQGHRRESGRQNFKNLLYCISEKHKEIEIVGCRGCGRGTVSRAVSRPAQSVQRIAVDDSNFMLCWYTHPNRGTHQVVGAAIHAEQYDGFVMIVRRNKPMGWSINYGNRAGGRVEKFLVHKADIAVQPHYFLPIEERQAVAVPEVEQAPLGEPQELPSESASQSVVDMGELSMPDPLEMPVPIDVEAIIAPKPEFNLQMIPGVGGALAKMLEADGASTKEAVLALGIEGLTKYRGVGEFKAKMIIEAASRE
jgi:glycosyltransferase involved in cell wall biosynthesis